MKRSLKRFRGLLVPLVLAVAAEAAFWAFVRTSDIIAPPSAILRAAVVSMADGELLRATGETLAATLMGLAIGGGAGALLGVVLGLSSSAAKVVALTVELLRPIPVIALIPLALLIYGFGYSMEVSIIVLATFWPCLILGQKSVAQVNKGLFEVGKVLELSPLDEFVKIIVPAAAPRLLLAIRVGLGIAIIVAVTVEIVSNPQGIGYFMMMSQQSLHPDMMLWGLVWVGILGWGLNAILMRVEARLFRSRAAQGGLTE